MDIQVIIVLFLTFIINVVGTLAYCTRVTGIKTGRIAVSLSIFNILTLVSRTASTIQGPILTKKVEGVIGTGAGSNMLLNLRYILFSATLGCILGAVVMPTFQRLFYKAVKSFDVYRSVPKLIIHSFSKSGIIQFKRCIKAPTRQNIHQLKQLQGMPKKVILFNIFATALSTTAVLSCLYAGLLNPNYRGTCITLTGVLSSVATILLCIFIDPSLSIMTDDVIAGKRSESSFKRCIMFMVSGRIAGTLVAQIILVPGAIIISHIAGN